MSLNPSKLTDAAVALLARPHREIGQLLLLIGTAVIFIASAVGGSLPQPMFGDWANGDLAMALGLGLGFAALAAAGLRTPPPQLVWPVALGWILAAAISAYSMVTNAPTVEMTVSMAEVVVLSAACLALVGGGGTDHFLRWAIAVTLVIFGAIHLLMRVLIASLIPDFIPFAAYWPWFTGSILIGSGLATPFSRVRGHALLVVATMFLAWVLLVHVPRLLASFSIGEVTFAAMAVALSGSLILCRAIQMPARHDRSDVVTPQPSGLTS